MFRLKEKAMNWRKGSRKLPQIGAGEQKIKSNLQGKFEYRASEERGGQRDHQQKQM